MKTNHTTLSLAIIAAADLSNERVTSTHQIARLHMVEEYRRNTSNVFAVLESLLTDRGSSSTRVATTACALGQGMNGAKVELFDIFLVT